jgi:hypothetical protein
MTEKRQTSQGYIIRILQHFATKLRNITNFVMLFQAVMKFLSRLVEIKISLKRGKVYLKVLTSSWESFVIVIMYCWIPMGTEWSWLQGLNWNQAPYILSCLEHRLSYEALQWNFVIKYCKSWRILGILLF